MQTLARKRQQLSNWEGSDTNAIDLNNAKTSLIQFQRNLLFQDSVAQQDTDEVEMLLTLGVDVDYANTDGITALHQVHTNQKLRTWFLSRDLKRQSQPHCLSQVRISRVT